MAWMFGCEFGLSQATCGSYKFDSESRGAKAGWGNCPSCVHREADPGETERQEVAWSREQEAEK